MGVRLGIRFQFVLNLEIPVLQRVIGNLSNLSYHGSWILENKPSLTLSAAFSFLISYVSNPISFTLTLLRTLRGSQKYQLPCFQAIPNSFHKSPGVGYPPPRACSWGCKLAGPLHYPPCGPGGKEAAGLRRAARGGQPPPCPTGDA